MASLRRATKANYVINDLIEAETSDREDHTFCGIMFPVKCKEILPIDHVIINSVAVRGALGPLTVWVTNNDENLNGEISMKKKFWTKIYEKTHKPCVVGYKELDFSSNPIVLKPGQVRGIYIHSTRRGDTAIVYDNKEKRKTHDDSFITILPGRAHVSEKAFGSVPIWGWGSAWRENREFVGQIKYGACYSLWNPGKNLSFGENFRTAARSLFMCQRRLESPFSTLPDDCIYFILNMMRWDWVNDTTVAMRREQKHMRRVRRQQMMEEADAIVAEMENDSRVEGEDAATAFDQDINDVVLGVDENDEANDFMDEDTSDGSEEADTSDEESTGSTEYRWGDHVTARSVFTYTDESDNDSDDTEEDDEEEIETEETETVRRGRMMRANRRGILQLFRSH